MFRCRLAETPDKAALLSGEQSRTTHGAVECVEASRLFGVILTAALQGCSHKTDVLLPAPDPVGPVTSPRLQQIASGAYFERTRAQIRGTGYVVDSLEAALWCFHTTDNFSDAVLAAANFGDDADTTAAITGQVAGAFYCEAGIPRKWIDAVKMSREIGEMAEQLSQGGGEIAMWVLLSGSFLSVVDKGDKTGNTLLVRARRRGDIESGFPLADIVEGAGTDYRYRARIDHEEIALRMADEVRGVRYPNFKSTVKAPERHDAYIDVWRAMYRFQEDSGR